MPVGTSDPLGKGMKQSTLGSGLQKSSSHEAKDRFEGLVEALMASFCRCFVMFIQVCGCIDVWSQLNYIVAVLRVLIDTAAEATWANDVLPHQRDVARLLQQLISDCDAADMTTHSHKLLTALMFDSRKILTLLT